MAQPRTLADLLAGTPAPQARTRTLADLLAESRPEPAQPAQEEQGFFAENFTSPAQRGYNRAQQTNAYMAGDVEGIAQQQRDLDALGQSEAVQRLAADTKGKGFLDTAASFADNPAAVWQMTVEALAQSLPGAIVAGKTGAMAGGAVGGALGSVVPGVGNVAGAAAGGLVGAMSGAAASSYAQSYTSTMMEAMRERGYDLADPRQVAAAFADEAFMDEAREKAKEYGLPVAVVDGISAGMAGKIYNVATKAGRAGATTAPSTARIVGGTVADAGAQGVMGGAGEAAGLANSGQDINWMDVLAETVAEVPGAAPEVMINRSTERKTAKLRERRAAQGGGEDRPDAGAIAPEDLARPQGENPDLPSAATVTRDVYSEMRAAGEQVAAAGGDELDQAVAESTVLREGALSTPITSGETPAAAAARQQQDVINKDIDARIADTLTQRGLLLDQALQADREGNADVAARARRAAQTMTAQIKHLEQQRKYGVVAEGGPTISSRLRTQGGAPAAPPAAEPGRQAPEGGRIAALRERASIDPVTGEDTGGTKRTLRQLFGTDAVLGTSDAYAGGGPGGGMPGMTTPDAVTANVDLSLTQPRGPEGLALPAPRAPRAKTDLYVNAQGEAAPSAAAVEQRQLPAPTAIQVPPTGPEQVAEMPAGLPPGKITKRTLRERLESRRPDAPVTPPEAPTTAEARAPKTEPTLDDWTQGDGNPEYALHLADAGTIESIRTGGLRPSGDGYVYAFNTGLDAESAQIMVEARGERNPDANWDELNAAEDAYIAVDMSQVGDRTEPDPQTGQLRVKGAIPPEAIRIWDGEKFVSAKQQAPSEAPAAPTKPLAEITFADRVTVDGRGEVEISRSAEQLVRQLDKKLDAAHALLRCLA